MSDRWGQPAEGRAPAAPVADAAQLTGLPAGARELGFEDVGGVRNGLLYMLGQMASQDPQQLAGIVRSLVPGAQTFDTPQGLAGVELPDGRRFYLNRPGASRADLMGLIGGLGSAVLAAIPAGGLAARLGGGLVTRVALQALAGGASSAALDAGAGALGSEEGVSPDRTALAAAGSGAAEALSGPLGRTAARVAAMFRSAPAARLVNADGTLTDTFRAALRGADLDPAELTAQQLEAIAVALRQAGARNADQALELARQAAARGGAGEFGIPMTAGQRTRDPAQLAVEDRLRGGGGGQAARTAMQEFDATQREGVEGAMDQLQVNAAGGRLPRLTEQDAAARVAQAARGRYDAARQAENAAWDAFRAGAPGETAVGREGVDALRDAARASVAEYPLSAATPTTQSVLERLAGWGRGADGEAGEVSLRDVDALRRMFGNARPSSPEDARALAQVRGAYDAWVDGLVDRGLVAGDDSLVEQLQRAVASSRERFALVSPPRAPGVPEATRRGLQQRLEALALDRDATGQQIANWLYGAASLSGGGEQRRLLRAAMRGLLAGEDEAREALRQGALVRIMRGPTENAGGYLRIADRIREATRGNGAEVTAELFGPAEIARLERLQAQLRNLAEQRRPQNPSGSAWTLLGSAMGGAGAGTAALMGGFDQTVAMALAAAGGAPGRAIGQGMREAAGAAAAGRATAGGGAETARQAGAGVAEQALSETPLARLLRRLAAPAGAVAGAQLMPE